MVWIEHEAFFTERKSFEFEWLHLRRILSFGYDFRLVFRIGVLTDALIKQFSFDFWILSAAALIKQFSFDMIAVLTNV